MRRPSFMLDCDQHTQLPVKNRRVNNLKLPLMHFKHFQDVFDRSVGKELERRGGRDGAS
jgi:hypothetical protein